MYFPKIGGSIATIARNIDPQFNDDFAVELIKKKLGVEWFAFMRADCLLRANPNHGILSLQAEEKGTWAQPPLGCAPTLGGRGPKRGSIRGRSSLGRALVVSERRSLKRSPAR